MNNQREIYEALLAGETLIHEGGMKAKLINGRFISSDYYLSQPYFYTTDNWQIYKEPKWYENIPEGGVLCWYNKYICVIYIADQLAAKHKYTPLTKQEIQVFMDNAPEDL